MNEQSVLAGLSEQFKALIGNQALMHQVFDLHPVPIEIFAPDGMCIFVNRAGLELNNIPDANLLVGKYTLKNDPVCLEILGQEVMDKIFRGEAVLVPDFPAPSQTLVNRGVIDEKPWEAALMDLFCLPIWDGGVFTFMICFFTVKNKVEGRADVVKAKAYIRENWREKFDMDALVAAVGSMSERHFRRLFKEVTGITPHAYYQKVKLEKIQEKLMDSTLSVAEAFTACGVDSHGAYFRLFKEKTGMTPSKYRKKR